MMKRLAHIAFLALCLALSASLKAQSVDDVNTLLCFGTVLDGDTVPYFKLEPVEVKEVWSLLTKAEIRKNQKLIRNVKKTLPYAQEARRRLQAVDRELSSMPPKQRKEYIKVIENELLDEFKEDLESMTISQGKVLLKLVDRETGNCSYELVAELRGKVRASFYQTFAKIFGFNLKAHYNPKKNKEDALIEKIVRSIEMGKL